MDSAVTANNRVKTKEKKKNKYLDLGWELKKLWNMKVTVIPIITSALGMIPKCLIKKQEELKIGIRAKTIQTTALLRSTIILKRVRETWEDLVSLTLQK